MKPYTKQDIDFIYQDFIKSAHKNVPNRYTAALSDIITAANWAYNFNHIYSDHKTEQLLKQIGDKTIVHVSIENPKKDHCVLIDSFLLDNRGLSQQYLRAMMANGMYILVFFTNAGGTVGCDTLAEIEAYDKAEIITYPKGMDRIEETRKMVSAIEDFSPAHIFLHILPWDVIALMACNACEGPIIYNINLTDHAFWLGSTFVDYNIEYRPCGMTISLEKRGFQEDQLIHLPYYPITPVCHSFNGLPNTPEGAIKVLTGGSVYKMLGAGGLFFNIMDRLLDLNSLIYIFVAGFEHDSIFDRQLKQMKNAERVINIGVRNDINAVFDNIDIYLNTYPIGGGLMLQYAASKGKPILAYREKENKIIAIEGIINPDGNPEIISKSFTEIGAMMDYAQCLILDKDFLEVEGKRIKDGLMKPGQFNSLFRDLLEGKINKRGWQEVPDLNYNHVFESYLERENYYGFNATYDMLLFQGPRALLKISKNKTKMLRIICKKIKKTPLGHLFRQILSYSFRK